MVFRLRRDTSTACAPTILDTYIDRGIGSFESTLIYIQTFGHIAGSVVLQSCFLMTCLGVSGGDDHENKVCPDVSLDTAALVPTLSDLREKCALITLAIYQSKNQEWN
jgi:hypothetical protein